jgi:tRNA(Ile)-lysidine synthase
MPRLTLPHAETISGSRDAATPTAGLKRGGQNAPTSGHNAPSPIDPISPAEPLSAARDVLSRLREPSTLLVAVSGGSDSVGLLIALAASLPSVSLRHRLVACTVDHALRPASAGEAEAVAARCRRLGIPHHTARWSHSGVTTGLQEQARLARYTLLLQTAEAVGADLVVTGHSADDQAETIAMRASRNPPDDAPGLAGMSDAVLFQGRLWIVRPFLHVQREDIRDMLRAQSESWIDDPSNEDRRFERVRVRQDRPRLTAPAPQRSSRRLVSGNAVAGHCRRHVTIHEALVAEIPFAAITLDDPDWRRLLTILAATLGGKTHGMGRDSADRLFAALRSDHSRAFTAGSVVFERHPGKRGASEDRLFLYRERRNLPSVILSPGEETIWDGRFAIANPGSVTLEILPGGQAPPRERVDTLVARGVPKAIAARAACAAPRLQRPEDTVPAPARHEAVPIIAPYDTFLPRFDLIIAQGLAERFGRAPYPACPVDISDGAPTSVDNISTN